MIALITLMSVCHVLHSRYTQTLLEELMKDILGIVEFHEVGRTLLEGLHEENLDILDFHDVGRNYSKYYL